MARKSAADVYTPQYQALYAELDESLDPGPPERFYEFSDGLGLSSASTMLDIGAGFGVHGLRISERHGCRVVAIDPLEWMLEEARRRFDAARLGARLETRVGVIEAIPAAADAFDLVLCRELLTLVEDLPRALAECRRVLRPGAAMLVYASFAAATLEPLEAERLNRPLGNAPASMDRENVERQFARAGFAVERREIVGTEWGEFREERARQDAPSRSLLRIARLMRGRELLVRRYGSDAYETALAGCTWLVYIMLGKLEPTTYLLRHVAT